MPEPFRRSQKADRLIGLILASSADELELVLNGDWLAAKRASAERPPTLGSGAGGGEFLEVVFEALAPSPHIPPRMADRSLRIMGKLGNAHCEP